MGIILSKTGATPTEKNRTDKPKRSAMTVPHSESTGQKRRQRFVLPDPPEREPEDMTSFDHLTINGSAHHLLLHPGSPETTLVASERYLTSAVLHIRRAITTAWRPQPYASPRNLAIAPVSAAGPSPGHRAFTPALASVQGYSSNLTVMPMFVQW